MIAGGFLAGGIGSEGAPAEFVKMRIRFTLDGIRNPAAPQRRELEAMSTVPGGDGQPAARGIVIDPKMLVQRVAVQAAAGVDNRRIGNRGESAFQKGAEVLFIGFGDDSLI